MLERGKENIDCVVTVVFYNSHSSWRLTPVRAIILCRVHQCFSLTRSAFQPSGSCLIDARCCLLIYSDISSGQYCRLKMDPVISLSNLSLGYVTAACKNGAILSNQSLNITQFSTPLILWFSAPTEKSNPQNQLHLLRLWILKFDSTVQTSFDE